MADTNPRVGSDTCTACRKTFKPGDRVVVAMIVIKVDRNPKAAWEQGSFCSEQYELAHISCADTGLEGRIIKP